LIDGGGGGEGGGGGVGNKTVHSLLLSTPYLVGQLSHPKLY